MANMSDKKDSDPVTFVVVSTAEIAKAKVIPALLSLPSLALIYGVSSRSKDRAQAFARDHCSASTGCRGMTHDEVLSCEEVDAVYVPLPSLVRNAFIRKAIEHGKHIYSEKPAGGTVKELKFLLDLAAERNLQWIDGTMWYHSTRTKAMEKYLLGDGDNGCLGKICRVSACFTWGSNGLVNQDWLQGGNGRTDPKREPMGMLGDSGHYPISAVAWAFRWELPTKIRVLHVKRNTLGAIITCEAYLWFKDGGRAIIEASAECPHRSQFEIVGDKGVLKVEDLVGGQGRSGNFSAYEGPFTGSSSFTLGDHLGKDITIDVEPSDHAQCLVSEFAQSVEKIRHHDATPNPEWAKRTLCTHTIMCCIFESAMRDGIEIELLSSTSETETKYKIGAEIFDDIPTKNWNENFTD